MRKFLSFVIIYCSLINPIFASEQTNHIDGKNISKTFINIGDKGISKLKASDLEGAKKLDFTNAGATDEGLKALLKILPDGLEELIFTNCSLTYDGINYMEHYPLPLSLKLLDFTHNKLGIDGTKLLISFLPPGLINLRLNINQIDDGFTAEEASHLPPMLKRLELAMNRINDTGIKALEPYLKNNPNLTALYLYKNPIGEVGTKILTDLCFSFADDYYCTRQLSAPPPKPRLKPKPEHIIRQMRNITDYKEYAARVVYKTRFSEQIQV